MSQDIIKLIYPVVQTPFSAAVMVAHRLAQETGAAAGPYRWVVTLSTPTVPLKIAAIRALRALGCVLVGSALPLLDAKQIVEGTRVLVLTSMAAFTALLLIMQEHNQEYRPAELWHIKDIQLHANSNMTIV